MHVYDTVVLAPRHSNSASGCAPGQVPRCAWSGPSVIPTHCMPTFPRERMKPELRAGPVPALAWPKASPVQRSAGGPSRSIGVAAALPCSRRSGGRLPEAGGDGAEDGGSHEGEGGGRRTSLTPAPFRNVARTTSSCQRTEHIRLRNWQNEPLPCQKCRWSPTPSPQCTSHVAARPPSACHPQCDVRVS